MPASPEGVGQGQQEPLLRPAGCFRFLAVTVGTPAPGDPANTLPGTPLRLLHVRPCGVCTCILGLSQAQGLVHSHLSSSLLKASDQLPPGAAPAPCPGSPSILILTSSHIPSGSGPELCLLSREGCSRCGVFRDNWRRLAAEGHSRRREAAFAGAGGGRATCSKTCVVFQVDKLSEQCVPWPLGREGAPCPPCWYSLLLSLSLIRRTTVLSALSPHSW